MAKFLVLCLILTDAFLFLSMADDHVAANPPAPSPSSNNGVSEGPSSRKIGRIWVESTREHNDRFVANKQESASGEHVQAGEDAKQQPRHRGFNKSIYGGGVILGGLATTFLVAVFCYIRATGRKNASDSPSSSPTASPRITDSV